MSSSSCSFLQPPTLSSLTVPNMLLNTLFSDTFTYVHGFHTSVLNALLFPILVVRAAHNIVQEFTFQIFMSCLQGKRISFTQFQNG
jgi:hypothetical protein